MSGKTISDYFAKDHDRLDGLFKQFQKYRKVDLTKAKPFFRDFKQGLERHIVWEEELLFPLFEVKTGIKDSGPIACMRLEHTEIKEALLKIHAKVARQDPATEAEEVALLSVLSGHNEKEESVLYPLLDRALDLIEKDRIFKNIQNSPDPSSHACCCEHSL